MTKFKVGDKVAVYGTTEFKSDLVRRVGRVTEVWPDGALSLAPLKGEPALFNNDPCKESGEPNGYDFTIVHPMHCRLLTPSKAVRVGHIVRVSKEVNSVWCNADMRVLEVFQDGVVRVEHPTHGTGAFKPGQVQRVKA